jgi:hypothetical protein
MSEYEVCRNLFDVALVDHCVQVLLSIKGFTRMFIVFLLSKCSRNDLIRCLNEQSEGFRKFVNIIFDEIKKTADEVFKHESSTTQS